MIKSGNSTLIGARAKVCIKSEGDLQALAMKLSESLQLPEFNFKSDTDYPHSITAMCESLGFETWLKSTDIEGEYSFEFCSMICGDAEPGIEDMSDVSDWFAQIVAVSTNLEVSSLVFE